jgi:hypothetical protein
MSLKISGVGGAKAAKGKCMVSLYVEVANSASSPRWQYTIQYAKIFSSWKYSLYVAVR